MTTFVKIYDYVFNQLGDKRVETWSMMSQPWIMFAIIAIYLFSIYIFLPAYMRDRKPFSLKKFIYMYNIFQVLACAGIIYGVITSGWTTHYSLGCQPVDYSNDPMSIRMLHFVYYTYLLKLIELVETVLFILRKKDNQVTNLHVYHHASTAALGWIAVKYVGGGMTTFPIIINCFIHMLMYTYYFLTALGPEWQKRMNRWKPKLTIAQMVQFAIVLVHASQAMTSSCDIPKIVVLIFTPNVVFMFYMFYKFYQKSYTQKHKKEKSYMN